MCVVCVDMKYFQFTPHKMNTYIFKIALYSSSVVCKYFVTDSEIGMYVMVTYSVGGFLIVKWVYKLPDCINDDVRSNQQHCP